MSFQEKIVVIGGGVGAYLAVTVTATAELIEEEEEQYPQSEQSL